MAALSEMELHNKSQSYLTGIIVDTVVRLRNALNSNKNSKKNAVKVPKEYNKSLTLYNELDIKRAIQVDDYISFVGNFNLYLRNLEKYTPENEWPDVEKIRARTGA